MDLLTTSAPSEPNRRTWTSLWSENASVLEPPPERYPDEWANENRILPEGSARPGPFDASETPYTIPMMRACIDVEHKTVVFVCGSQMAKTTSLQNIMGQIIDDDPAPLLYVAPTKTFIEETWEPAFMAMVNSCESLSSKMLRGQQEKKTLKRFGAIKVRFGWAGSATQLAGDAARKVIIDERDRMKGSVGGEGDPKKLADNRHATYADGQTIVASTPLEGNVDSEFDRETGLEHWTVSDSVQSPTWQLWQQGTRHEWAWPCPKCGEYFVPRFKWLIWPKGSSPSQAKAKAKVKCPNCEAKIDNADKEAMNARGVFVAPGQWIDLHGQVHGKAPQSEILSFWVSGICSPWKTFGDRAASWLEACRSGEPDQIQVSINTDFGELYAIKGEAPPKDAIAELRLPYRMGDVPLGVHRITMGVDVQQDRLVYEIRGWGQAMESWILEHGDLWGDTSEPAVWRELAAFRDVLFDDTPIERVFVDSGYRAADVYDFCRAHEGWACPSKGRDAMDKPLHRTLLDRNPKGKVQKSGLALWIINTDHFKTWVHNRLARDPSMPGGWHLSQDTSDEYCDQLVAEERITTPSGRVYWQRVSTQNHYFDTAVLNVACAYSLGIHAGAVNADGGGRTRLVEKAEAPAVEKQRTNMGGRGEQSSWFRGRRNR